MKAGRSKPIEESDNRLTLNLPQAGELHAYTYDVADQISERRVNGVLKETFTHDADGNMIARVLNPGGQNEETVTMTWNDFDSLVRWEKQPAGTSEMHSYDSGGIRKSKMGTDGVKVEFKYSGLPVLGEKRDPSGTPTEWAYIHGHQVMGFQKASDFFYFITDGLSSVRVLVNASGNEVAHYIHDEFGRRVEVVENGGSSLQTYVGGLGVRDESPASGLLYMRQRWMDPALGRFLSRDRLPASPNQYTYVENNPLRWVDPHGLQPESAAVELFKQRLIQGGTMAAADGPGLAGDIAATIWIMKGLLDLASANSNRPEPALDDQGRPVPAPSPGPCPKEDDDDDDLTLYRLGESWESQSRLQRKSEEALRQIGLFGVSVSAMKHRDYDISTSTLKTLNEAGFVVLPTPTRRDPLHFTVLFTDPVTNEAATLFNIAFGRSRRKGRK
ncbi:MAG: RHS repeat-associated core domain-containing protein [Armatimonadetes bacterium]|nr:RHS repeat-associated core domain-containing protein [Armatimonadota bacterium]